MKDKNRQEMMEALSNSKAYKDAQKRMKEDVSDLEMKARYWKAQFEIRYFTLEAEKLQQSYDTYLKDQMEKNEQAQKEFQERMAQLAEKDNVEVTTDGSEEQA